MTRFITKAIYQATKQAYAVSGNSVDDCMKELRRMKEVRNAVMFEFINRKTGKLVDVRFN